LANERDPDPESWACIDCGFNTAPGLPTRSQMSKAFTIIAKEREAKIDAYVDSSSEVYYVKPQTWKAAGIGVDGGCLCIGCLELRLGRNLTPKDFPEHPFNRMTGTKRLLDRRGMPRWLRRYAWAHRLGGEQGGR
jgi:hypothetical protein